MAHQVNIIPQRGEHVLSVGQNGSGKTVLNIWILLRVPDAPTVIYDTKIEPKFDRLPANKVVTNMKDALALKDDQTVDYIVIRPPVEMMRDPMALDEMLWEHYLHFSGCPAYIDEAYTFHNNGRAGPGLTALLTRGRSRGISTIISTQRPVLLSRFCVTEAKKVFTLRLTDKADKKRLEDVIPNFASIPNPPKHGFYFFEPGVTEEPILFRPIKIDPAFDTGYFDVGAVNEANTTGKAGSDATDTPAKHVWV